MKENRKYRRAKVGIKFIYKVMGVKGETTVSSVDLGEGVCVLIWTKKSKQALW
jgi:hypothetical protein